MVSGWLLAPAVMVGAILGFVVFAIMHSSDN